MSSIYIIAPGREPPSKPTSTLSAPTKRPAFSPGLAFTPPSRRPQDSRCASNMSTGAAGLSPTWRPGTFTAPSSSAAASRRPGSSRSVVHLPVHASWLNQIEIYFSIVQRKVVTPADFISLQALASTILAFQVRYEQIATPFAWKFTREKLATLMAKLSQPLPNPLARCA